MNRLAALLTAVLGFGCATQESTEDNTEPATRRSDTSRPESQQAEISGTRASSPRTDDASAVDDRVAAAPEADLRPTPRNPGPGASEQSASTRVDQGPGTGQSTPPDAGSGPPIGAWNRGDGVAAIVADRAILESDVYQQARLLHGTDREPTLLERQGVLLRMVQEALLLQITLQQHGERGLELANQIATEKRDEQIREIGFLDFVRRTEAGGSTLKADFEARKKEILLAFGRQYIQQQHFGDYRHLQVSPQDIRDYYDAHFEEEFAARPPQVGVDIAQFRIFDGDQAPVEAFAEAWRQDPDAELPEGVTKAHRDLDFGSEPTWPDWLSDFARDGEVGEVSEPMVGSRDYFRHVVRIGSRVDLPQRNLDDPEVQEEIRNHLLIQRLDRVVEDSLRESLPQIPIWPPEVKRQVRLLLTR